MLNSLKRNIVILLLLTTLLLAGSSIEKQRCSFILNRFGINPNLKSNASWIRVCNNDKLSLYTDKDLSVIDKEIICNCLVIKEVDRSIVNFKGSE